MQTYRARLALILGQKQRQRPARHYQRPTATVATIARRQRIARAVADLAEFQRRDTAVVSTLAAMLFGIAGVLIWTI